ncbi:MAG: O-acetylhomoserine aminocarboxypropyltransferase/cysteine synthase family protein [Candidatus Treponema excrementipullorum]|nr:O-acetylhomoserine aminocarboxypropyltransferase/cysteine synthase [Spirochaetia bacterium]MDD7013300.1 O-acetylhomoserine aminocarboxypropyltransferase/cysteine synthase [Candidatus Treponema excrementipullorum]MCI6952647.1 O-acetylhomoserine aminocarboxypropyltransferase/cysteine synthase [Spirochaetia bacterium]MCI7589397.1 O-acetylhomoserine aminocarboxypropyltransferase/cysteine synthase [Spirochaetia bacterium]MDY2756368.1 O-acetylhomoserine aminocarboxypropyltransferase/cysteine synth
MEIETQCLHEGYTPKNGEPRVVPIVQSTTYCFDSTEHIAQLFDMPTEYMYSRFANPTCDAVEKKIAALEGGVGAMLTSSGQSAVLCTVLNLCKAGDSLVAVSAIYGGVINLLSVTLNRLGIECIWVAPDSSEEVLRNAIKDNTKLVFGETIANPALRVLDLELFAKVAHEKQIPLVVDSTFATPILCKPIEWGADIVIHSTTKYMDGHAVQMGGVIVDSGKFDWSASPRFPDFVTPDESYHGVVYTRDFGAMAFIIKARMQLMRDFGCYQTPQGAFLLNLGLETLALRMERYSQNALEVAQHLKKSSKIESVSYPGLPSDIDYPLTQKYLKKGASGVITFVIKGGRAAAVRFMDAMKLASRVVHVADIRTCVLHPASSTHRQLTDQQLLAAGINPGMIRFSCGLEHISDIIEDIDQALEKV